MASITAWNRLESGTRSREIERGLQARIADPIWMLLRQRQLGEFLGEDAPSPVQAQVDVESTRLTKLELHDADGNAVVGTLPEGPLEALVERETVLKEPSIFRRSLEAGFHAVRVLATHGEVTTDLRSAFRRAFPLVANEGQLEGLDAASRRLMDITSDRGIDGIALRDAIRVAGAMVVPPELGLTGDEESFAATALAEWADWYDKRYSEPDPGTTGWMPERMEYGFAVSAPLEDQELVLRAREYHGGHLDWHSFDITGETALGDTAETAAMRRSTFRMLPTPLSYPGMPASRFWEFEDRNVHLSRFSAGPSDISKVLLVEFAMVYGDDWFRVPVDISMGDLVRVDSLRVKDNFGDETAVPAATQVDGSSSPWRLYTLHGDPALSGGTASSMAGMSKGPWLVRPPSLARSLNSAVLEEVVFTRDEMANLAWAIERTVECATGKPISRAERWLEQKRAQTADEVAEHGEVDSEEEETDAGAAVARYRIQTKVPDYWLPLVPVRHAGNDSMILRRGRHKLPSGELSPEARGRLLDPGNRLLVYEEEVPRGGICVSRHWQLARWTDGSTWLWLARRKRPGRGERSSGLRYDLIEE